MLVQLKDNRVNLIVYGTGDTARRRFSAVAARCLLSVKIVQWGGRQIFKATVEERLETRPTST